jgi:excisionase family DNA binding protein
MDEIFTVEQVADYLKVSISTVRRLIKAKKLKAYKVGNQYRIRKADLERLSTDECDQPRK